MKRKHKLAPGEEAQKTAPTSKLVMRAHLNNDCGCESIKT
jgi:hypothetical protein